MWVVVNEYTLAWLSSFFHRTSLVVGEVVYLEDDFEYAHTTEYRGKLIRDHTDSEVQQYILDWTLNN